MTASARRRTRLDPGLDTLWLVRWMRENRHPTTTVLYDRETAVSYYFRKVDAGLPQTRMYRVDIAGLAEEPPSDAEWRGSADDRFGPVIWTSRDCQMTRTVGDLCHTDPDAESVEFVVDGSPGGPAADLLDSARFAPLAPADSLTHSRSTSASHA